MTAATTTRRTVDGWELIEAAPAEQRARVLLLPGWLCTDVMWGDVMALPALHAAGVQAVAANPPGFAGLPLPSGFHLSIPGYADALEGLLAAEPFDLVVGHSFSGNVCIELAARGTWPGGLMLVAPSLRRAAEPADSRVFDRLLRLPILGEITLRLGWRALGTMFESYFAEATRHRLPLFVAEARRSPRALAPRLINAFFDDLDRHGDLTPRLAASRSRVWYVRGSEDKIVLPPDARAALEASGHVTIHEVPGSRHFVMLDRPEEVGALILSALQELQALPSL